MLIRLAVLPARQIGTPLNPRTDSNWALAGSFMAPVAVIPFPVSRDIPISTMDQAVPTLAAYRL